MAVETMTRVYELSDLIGIKTLGDLKRFCDDYQLVKPTGKQLLAALEKELEVA